jgi:hypothetical protein
MGVFYAAVKGKGTAVRFGDHALVYYAVPFEYVPFPAGGGLY